MSILLKFRVDLSDKLTEEEVADRFRKMAKECVDLFVVKETTNKIHYHGYVETRKKVDTFRNYLKFAFKVSGTQYATEVFDAKKTGYFNYMCKGHDGKRGDEVFVIVDLHSRLIQSFHDAYHDWVEKPAEDGGKRLKKLTFVEQCVEECSRKGFTSKADVMRCVACNKFALMKGFDRYMIVKMFWPVYIAVNGGEGGVGMSDLLDQCMQSVSA